MESFNFEKAMADHDAWEASQKGVRYNLNLDDTTDGPMEVLIVQTVMRLPDEVKEYVYEDCRIAAIGGEDTLGAVFAPGTQWFVMLDATIAKKFDDKTAMGIIAHEIAHAWLKHDKGDWRLKTTCEPEAADLAAQWGFTGFAASADEMKKRYGIED
jgi:hypothetical protein